MKETVKKLPEKLEYTLQGIEGRQTKCVPDNKTIMDKVNEIIDYLQPVHLTATEAQVIQREREHELIQAYEKGKKDATPTPQATSVDTSKVTRFEVIDDNGRAYVNMDCKVNGISMQDGNKTIKLFIKNNKSKQEVPVDKVEGDWIDKARDYRDEYRDTTKSFKEWFRESIEKHIPTPPTPTVQPVTSNVEEIAKKILDTISRHIVGNIQQGMNIYNTDNRALCDKIKKLVLEAHIPQQKKKRTREEVTKLRDDNIIPNNEGDIDATCMFLNRVGLLEE